MEMETSATSASASEEAPSVLKIASMFASLSSSSCQQNHHHHSSRTTVISSSTASTTATTKSVLEAASSGTRSAGIGQQQHETVVRSIGGPETTKNVFFYSATSNHNSSGGGNAALRTRSRSSDSRPACLDLKVIDNRTKFDHVKALFENLERQSRMEQRHQRTTPHNGKKRVASPSPTRSSTTNGGGETNNHHNHNQAGGGGRIAAPLVTATRIVPTTIGGKQRPPALVHQSPTAGPTSPAAVASPPPVPPKPRSPVGGETTTTAVVGGRKGVFQRQWTFDSVPPVVVAAKNGSPPPPPVPGGQRSPETTTAGGGGAEEGRGGYYIETAGQDVPDGGVRTTSSRLAAYQQTRGGGAGDNNHEPSPMLLTGSVITDGGDNISSNSKPPAATTTSPPPPQPPPPGSDTAAAMTSPRAGDKPGSLYEPYWRAHRYAARQRLANGAESSSSSDGSSSSVSQQQPVPAPAIVMDSYSSSSTKRNYLLKTGSQDSSSPSTPTTADGGKNNMGRLDIVWPPANSAGGSPTTRQLLMLEKEGTTATYGQPDSSSPPPSTTAAVIGDTAAPSLANSTLYCNTTTTTTTKGEDPPTATNNVALMTKEEASVLLSPSTRDVVLRETRGRSTVDGAASGEGENGGDAVCSLPSHLSIPQDVDLKRLSMCSLESNSEHGGSTTERYSVSAEDANVHMLSDGHFWMEVPGLVEEPQPPSPTNGDTTLQYKKPSRVKFSTAPIKVFSTYTGLEYDRRNDDVDPVSASAEYELERRLEKMDLLEVEMQKGPEGLGFSIIGMGVGADAGLEKLGIFVKSITPGGAVHKDGRIIVCDQIVEVDGKSLVGVSQNYAASVLRSTSGIVRFKIGREKDLDSSEIAALIRQSLEQDRLLREQEDHFQRRLEAAAAAAAGGGDRGSMLEEMMENGQEQHYNNYEYRNYLLAPGDHHQQQQGGGGGGSRTPLPSTDSVFTHEDEYEAEDRTPEQLVDSNPHIDRLMDQLRQPFASSSSSIPATATSNKEIDQNKGEEEDEQKNDDKKMVGSPAEGDDQDGGKIDIDQAAFQSPASSSLISPGAITINRPPVDSSSSIAAPPVQPLAVVEESPPPPYQYQQQQVTSPRPEPGPGPGPGPGTVYGQLFRTNRTASPDFTSSMESMNGSEIQVRINALEAELTDVRLETDKYQTLLNDSKQQYDDLETKYSRAKKLIADYQDREKDLLDREEAHLRALREKDEQYANLVKILKEKVLGLEKQLLEAHRKRASIVESTTVAAGGSSSSASDLSPALAYLPAKKLDSTTTAVSNNGSSNKLSTVAVGSVRIVPIIREPSLSGTEIGSLRKHKPDFGVPATELLDSTAARCKADVVKQSQTMSSRSLPSRRPPETEIFIMCHHTLEHAQTLRAHGGGSASAATTTTDNGGAGPSGGTSPSKSESGRSAATTSAGSPVTTPRRVPLTSRAASTLLLPCRKRTNKRPVDDGTSSHCYNSALPAVIGGGGSGEGSRSTPTQPPAIPCWTCDDVCRFLKSIGLDKYTPEFSINRIDGCKLLQLDGSRLKAMGVQNHSDRSLVKKQIKDMKARIERERKQVEKESRRLLKLEKDKSRHH